MSINQKLKNPLAYIEKVILNDETHKEIKTLSNSYMQCITDNFIPKFLSGDDVKVADFCSEEYGALIEKQKEFQPDMF